MIYDIRTIECARQTLTNLTQVPIEIWEENVCREKEYRYVDDLVENVANTYGVIPDNYQKFEFIYFHVTTSANQCLSIRKRGIMDLRNTYLCKDSELRQFLDTNGIYININEKTLTYKNSKFDISYHPYAPRFDTEERDCWAIGRKFYYDFTTCGFLSVWETSPYGGQVQWRPEILMDIDNLLSLNLSNEWASTHTPYEVTAKVSGEKIVYDGDDEQSEKEKVIYYLTKAYQTAFGDTSEEVLLLKNNIQIPVGDIIEVKPLTHWSR